MDPLVMIDMPSLTGAAFWHAVLLRSDDAEESIASILRLIRISELGTTLAVTNNWNKLRRS
jgi:hypothetical protein